MNELWALFISAFISSSILPGGSEAYLIYLVTQQEIDNNQLWLAATLGNTLGGMSSFILGAVTIYFFPATDFIEKHSTSIERVKKYGVWSLFFSWLPVIGDPLCIAAGWLRINWMVSLLFIALGKGLRYGFIIWLVN